ncbi:RHS repeat-associated core domain-containing protein [Sorangium sp. So ce1024]|uniref:RHS repeat-associated core domain-containing protein n=1 Tax=Sorangium sp. So ce1024 TaxID=3133327 RepID=UPI003EFEA8E6
MSTFGDPEDEPSSPMYVHDAHGNMTAMPHIAALTWDENDQLRSTDLDGGGVVYHAYDAGGQRVRKVWEHSGLVEERIYLGGYEVYRKRNAAGLVLERQTLHVMDGARRVAMVEAKTVDTSGPFTVTPRVRYQLDNHLGSASLEVDGAGLVIGYEEYHPYGTTAYWSTSSAVEVSQRRYRYTGKEKDEGTGLYYYGARYYTPWLGRWTAADPAGMVDGPNRYAYVRGNPVRLHDPSGTHGNEPNYGLERLQHINAVISAQLGVAPASQEEVKAQRDDAVRAARAPRMSEVRQAEAPETESTDPDPLYRLTGVRSGEPPPDVAGMTTETFPEYPGSSYSYQEPETQAAEIFGNFVLVFGPAALTRISGIGGGQILPARAGAVSESAGSVAVESAGSVAVESGGALAAGAPKGGFVFRGTTEGYAGNPALQKSG